MGEVYRANDLLLGQTVALKFLPLPWASDESTIARFRNEVRIGRLPQDKALEIARQLCAGVAAAHDKGVVHRDLKPGNIMLDGQGQLRITDFGLAGVAGELKDIRSGTPGKEPKSVCNAFNAGVAESLR
jgi:serine/threonine protein kinase